MWESGRYLRFRACTTKRKWVPTYTHTHTFVYYSIQHWQNIATAHVKNWILETSDQIRAARMQADGACSCFCLHTHSINKLQIWEFHRINCGGGCTCSGSISLSSTSVKDELQVFHCCTTIKNKTCFSFLACVYGVAHISASAPLSCVDSSSLTKYVTKINNISNWHPAKRLADLWGNVAERWEWIITASGHRQCFSQA